MKRVLLFVFIACVSLLFSCKEELNIIKGVTDLSKNGTANCYIVSSAGNYKFPAVQGNSTTSVGVVNFVEVLWESFGTASTPSVGDLIKSPSYSLDGYITFQTAETFKEGNALIAAKDVSGKILWSWHIWLTDNPKDQVYYNNAGIMMDRNLGAISTTPGDIEALGLFYQWGRKDPFLGGAAINYDSTSNQQQSASTLSTWPSAVTSDSSNGTIAYAQENPTTFIMSNSINYDWYYTGASTTDNTRWQSTKTIYDPCPVGYHVPDAGENGIWTKSLDSTSSFEDTSLCKSTAKGYNFSKIFGDDNTIWYPLAGYLYRASGQLCNVGHNGYYWSVTPNSDNYVYYLYFYCYDYINPESSNHRANAFTVRCQKEVSI